MIQLFTYDLVTQVLSWYTQTCESMICPQVIRCSLQDIKIQTLTNQKEALKRKKEPYTTLKATEPLVSQLVLQFLCSVSHTS